MAKSGNQLQWRTVCGGIVYPLTCFVKLSLWTCTAVSFSKDIQSRRQHLSPLSLSKTFLLLLEHCVITMGSTRFVVITCYVRWISWTFLLNNSWSFSDFLETNIFHIILDISTICFDQVWWFYVRKLNSFSVLK